MPEDGGTVSTPTSETTSVSPYVTSTWISVSAIQYPHQRRHLRPQQPLHHQTLRTQQPHQHLDLQTQFPGQHQRLRPQHPHEN